MGNNKQNWKHIIILLGLFLFLITISIYGIIKFSKLILTLPKEISAPLNTICGTIILSVLSLILAKYYEKKKEIEQEIRKNKITI